MRKVEGSNKVLDIKYSKQLGFENFPLVDEQLPAYMGTLSYVNCTAELDNNFIYFARAQTCCE